MVIEMLERLIVSKLFSGMYFNGDYGPSNNSLKAGMGTYNE